MTTHVALYTRLSKDETGSQTATRRQEAACRAFAELREWEVIQVFEDVDLSAYRREVQRPAYERLLQALEDGRIQGVVVWKLDRLVRRPAEFERFWAVCEQAGAVLASASEPIDTSNELGLALVRILVSFAGLESATLGFRIRAKMAELARSGAAPSQIGFGYRRNPVRIISKEAVLIREAAERVLAGQSLRSIALDWNARGIQSPRGQCWRPQALKGMLRSPRLVGDRVHRGEVVARDCWPAILDRKTFDRLQRTLRAPKPAAVKPARVHLLTGLLLCGCCGSRMRAVSSGGTVAYRCPQAPVGCNRIQINAPATDGHIFEMLCHHMDDLSTFGRTIRLPDRPAVTEGTQTTQGARIRDIRDDYYLHHLIGRDEYLAYRQAILSEGTGSDRSAGASHPTPPLTADRLRRRWPDMSVGERRDQIDLQIHTITIRPAVRREFDARRVAIEWRHHPNRQRARTTRLSTIEAAEHLGVHPATVSRWIREGRLPAQKIGRSFFVTETDLKSESWTISRTAEYLGVHTSTVFRWIRTGTVPARRLAGALELADSDVRALAQARAR